MRLLSQEFAVAEAKLAEEEAAVVDAKVKVAALAAQFTTKHSIEAPIATQTLAAVPSTPEGFVERAFAEQMRAAPRSRVRKADRAAAVFGCRRTRQHCTIGSSAERSG